MLNMFKKAVLTWKLHSRLCQVTESDNQHCKVFLLGDIKTWLDVVLGKQL